MSPDHRSVIIQLGEVMHDSLEGVNAPIGFSVPKLLHLCLQVLWILGQCMKENEGFPLLYLWQLPVDKRLFVLLLFSFSPYSCQGW